MESNEGRQCAIFAHCKLLGRDSIPCVMYKERIVGSVGASSGYEKIRNFRIYR